MSSGHLMVIKGMQPCEKGKDSFKDNKEHVFNMLNILYTVMWKREPMKKQQGIDRIIKHIKLLQTESKVRRNETCISTSQFSQKRTVMQTTGCNPFPLP